MTADVDEAETAALVRAATLGEESAWEALVRRFSGLVWSIARGHGLAQPDAEDVFQVTWLRLAQHIGRVKEADRVGAWLAATARNESLRVGRIGARTTPSADLENILPPISATPEKAALDAESRAAERRRDHQLWQAFEELSVRCRALLRAMMTTPPLSYAEIAEVFDMPVGSIGPTRARCLQRLRALIQERGITGAGDGS